MADKFRVGQKVRKFKLGDYDNGVISIGTIGTITKERGYCVYFDKKIRFSYSTDIGNWHPTEDIIEPLYDGDEASSWSNCAWRPKPQVIDNKLPEAFKEKS